MPDYYVLDGHETVPCDLITWAGWLENNRDRHVGIDHVGDVKVSTVFLGLNHQYWVGPPLLFETMVFGGPLDGEQWRCTTWAEAEAQHAMVLVKVKGVAHV